MKRKNTALVITGIFMILAAWGAIATAVLIFISRLSAVGASLSKSVLSGLLILVWAFIDLGIGFSCVTGRKRKKQLRKYFALGIFSIVLFFIQSFLSAANGIVIIHLVILIVCGFVIPCLHLSVCCSRM